MDDADLYSLAYVSRNTIGDTARPIAEEIDHILARSRENNRRADVTGALLFSDGWFAQVLEGRLPEVKATFERVQRDPRHADVTVLYLMPIDARDFGNWAMANASAPGATPVNLGATLDAPDASAAGTELVALLRDMIHNQGQAADCCGSGPHRVPPTPRSGQARGVQAASRVTLS